MGKTRADERRTTEWAIASVGAAGGVVGSYAYFFLVNRETGREHGFHIVGGGPSAALGGGGGSPSYTTFRTAWPVSFEDFDGVGVRLTSANVGLIYGYSWNYLTIWRSSAYISDRLAYVKMGGGAFMLPGGASIHGVGLVSYGAGTRSGTVPLVLNLPDKIAPVERVVHIRVVPRESPRIVLPPDVLFDFDRATISKEGHVALATAADILNNRERWPVVIEGHTDAKGTDPYNMRLARARADAVKDWFVRKQVVGSPEFKVEAYGERRPVAPNLLPDGRDNPEGRRVNRRVEIRFEGAVPDL